MYPRVIVNAALAAALLGGGCGGSAVTDEGGTGGTAPATCPNLAGTWFVASHCDPRFLGAAVQVTQSACSFTDQTFGFTGTIDANGAFTATSTIAAVAATCTGTATAASIAQTCVVPGGTCTINLTR